jgi:predicted DNA-binding transcriptional regulator AlpA
MTRNFTTQQTAEILGVKASTLEVWRVYGKGPRFCRVGGRRIVYPEDEINAYQNSLKRCQSTSEKD